MHTMRFNIKKKPKDVWNEKVNASDLLFKWHLMVKSLALREVFVGAKTVELFFDEKVRMMLKRCQI